MDKQNNNNLPLIRKEVDMKYAKIFKRLNDFTVTEYYKYFETEDALKSYLEVFKKAERPYDFFVQETGDAAWNSRGILVP